VELAKLSIAIKLNKQISDLAIQISEEISSKFEAEFTLGLNYLPHITLLYTEFPRRNLEKIQNMIKNIVANTEIFELKFDKLFAQKGYVDISFKVDDKIMRLHNEILEKSFSFERWLHS